MNDENTVEKATVPGPLEFFPHHRMAVAELADWHPGLNMAGISVSEEDARNGSPKLGDKIARNPKNHADRWLVAADYYRDNFKAVTSTVKPIGADGPSPIVRMPNEPGGVDSRELPEYRCHKVLRAARIISVNYKDGEGQLARPLLRLDVGPRGVTMSVPRYWFENYHPMPGGFFLLHDTGACSFCPGDAFQDAYTRIPTPDPNDVVRRVGHV